MTPLMIKFVKSISPESIVNVEGIVCNLLAYTICTQQVRVFKNGIQCYTMVSNSMNVCLRFWYCCCCCSYRLKLLCRSCIVWASINICCLILSMPPNQTMIPLPRRWVNMSYLPFNMLGVFVLHCLKQINNDIVHWSIHVDILLIYILAI
jgi:hypothetical protein